MTPSEFKDRYPEFSAVADSRVTMFLDDAALELDVFRWGGFYLRGLAALAAHLLTIGTEGMGSPSGAVSSRSVGDVSVSFAVDASNDVLASTAYGREYIRLRRFAGVGALVIR